MESLRSWVKNRYWELWRCVLGEGQAPEEAHAVSETGNQVSEMFFLGKTSLLTN